MPLLLDAAKMAETPSAYFAVQPPEVLTDTPNMQYVDLVVQSTAGITLCTTPGDLGMAQKLAPLAEVVEKDDTIMAFTIRVLVNCVDLKKGDLLTKPRVEKPKSTHARKHVEPITSNQVLKKMKHR